jgi:hypothetical protein
MKSKLRICKETVTADSCGRFTLSHPVYDDVLLGTESMSISADTEWGVRRDQVTRPDVCCGAKVEFTYLYLYDYDTRSSLVPSKEIRVLVEDRSKCRIIPIRVTSASDPAFELVVVPETTSAVQSSQTVYRGEPEVEMPITLSDYTTHMTGTLKLKLESFEPECDVYSFTITLNSDTATLPSDLELTFNYEFFGA